VIKGVVLAGVVGALSILVATGRVDDLRSQIGLKENPFDTINEALKEPSSDRLRQRIAWGSLTREANSICSDYRQQRLVIKKTLPRDRSAYARALRKAIARERLMQPELAKLKAPPNYRLAYSRFLHDRKGALAGLENQRKAVQAKDRNAFALAARSTVRSRTAINVYVQAVAMPACVF
jgi:hypothetical protein